MQQEQSIRIEHPPSVYLHTIECLAYGHASSRSGSRFWLRNNALLAVSDGQGIIFINGQRYTASKGKCLLIPLNTAIEINSDERSSIKLYLMTFEVERDEAGLFTSLLEMIFEPFARLDGMLQELLSEQACLGKLDAFHMHIRFQYTLYEVLKRHSPAEQDTRRAVEKSISFMHRCYHENIAVGRLAEEANISKWQFSTMFRSLTGQTPMDYLTALRMDKAKLLMLSSGGRIREIAASVGFPDEYYFSRRFKQTTGMTPTQYMQSSQLSQRIFSIQYLGELLALGIKPVGTNRAMLSVFHDVSSGVQGIEEPLDAEQLLELRPDMILFPSFMQSSQADQLSKIAPSFEISWQDDVYSRLMSMGDLLGRRKEAGAWIARYESKAERTRAKLAPYIERGETATAFVYHAEGLYVYADHHFGHTLYQGLGYEKPAKLKKLMAEYKQLKWKQILLEELPDYAGDRIFLALADTGIDAEQGRAIVRHPIWNSLPAVQNGRGHVVDMSWGNYNPITLEKHLDEMVKWIAAGYSG
ncbi:helix-turn-helix domain-containing protein [Paenibacillus sinopodophylli]|uniref:helix-turn-helix domain-containing protein n=1 Tax=Paenibacillus sinopodophylli TaxID=1837342 RepID=UPI00110D001A|nr:helix-turn-helix domain-containing protein [Paenibacillus sinopodophylli]